MAKVTLATITGGYAAIAALNANFTALAAALENTLSRDGTSPNTLTANLDINGKRILNLPDALTSTEPVTLQQLQGAAVATDIPSQTGHAGKVLQTDGLAAGWNTIAAILGSTLSAAADKLPYFTDASTLSLADLTAAGRALLDDADNAAQRTTLGFSGASGTVATANIENAAVTTAKIADGNVTTAKVEAAISGFLVPTGVILDYAGSAAPTGWLLCDGSAVSRTTYAALFAVLSTTYGSGDGSTTFNLPDFRGRIVVGAGTGTLSESGVDAGVDIGADTLTVASNTDKWVTGMLVNFTLQSGTITGLTSGNNYYIIRASATTLKLASSLANAQNGTAIDMTAKSSPAWTITHTLTARTRGDKGGEEAHAMSSSELLSHTHPFSITQGNAAGSGSHAVSGNIYSSTPVNPDVKGGNAAMNNMQPYGVAHKIVKT